ncbi:Uncharacterised protein [Mycolicibacterium phlei]|nr:hypothetical protein MPHLCCUG_01628 [Mycolicibacterium phlei]KXW61942.1 hypothetical protein MPHL43072_09730 [Mycolicibacterium phlei DSM 43072]KXW73208.1 hypothetical protein MPHL43070_02415 [Mycolicibacterium phlei DSM 43070]STZ17020.1 Uncharacterised protein [Mycolicibacterium phlei]VEG08572.1 Uncharacterised protein [Mycobacteroides chelonae]
MRSGTRRTISIIRTTELPQPQQMLDAEQESGATDTTDENCDLHIDRD